MGIFFHWGSWGGVGGGVVLCLKWFCQSLVQTIAKFKRNIVGSNILRQFGHPVVTCCDMWEVLLAQIWKKSNFSCNICRWCCSRLTWILQQCCVWACAKVRFSIPNMSQHVATGCTWPNARNRLALNNVAICCVQLLRSFGRSLQILGQQRWDMLKCCDRLAGA